MKKPNHTIIEQTALELAATYYEIGRGQGLTSKYKNPRDYAKAMFPKFIPRAVDILLSMLGRKDLPDLMKAEIYEAVGERIADPEYASLTEMVPDFKEAPNSPINVVSKPKPFKEQLKNGTSHNPFLRNPN